MNRNQQQHLFHLMNSNNNLNSGNSSNISQVFPTAGQATFSSNSAQVPTESSQTESEQHKRTRSKKATSEHLRQLDTTSDHDQEFHAPVDEQDAKAEETTTAHASADLGKRFEMMDGMMGPKLRGDDQNLTL